jgi:hypothetical protein
MPRKSRLFAAPLSARPKAPSPLFSLKFEELKLSRNPDGNWSFVLERAINRHFVVDGTIRRVWISKDGLFLVNDAQMAWPVEFSADFEVVHFGAKRANFGAVPVAPVGS